MTPAHRSLQRVIASSKRSGTLVLNDSLSESCSGSCIKLQNFTPTPSLSAPQKNLKSDSDSASWSCWFHVVTNKKFSYRFFIKVKQRHFSQTWQASELYSSNCLRLDFLLLSLDSYLFSIKKHNLRFHQIFLSMQRLVTCQNRRSLACFSGENLNSVQSFSVKRNVKNSRHGDI